VTSRPSRRLLQAGVALLLLAGVYYVRARSNAGPEGGADWHRTPAGNSPRSPDLDSSRSPTAESSPSPSGAPSRSAEPTSGRSGLSVLDAFQSRRSNIEVVTGGRVTRVLADDREGAQHQRFLVRIAGSVTVLVAHNLDLAPRVPLAAGDSVELRGEYEWNQLGGVVHWTHRDPGGRHEAGWIRHAGRLYQ
jgi:hypothetical protein